MDKQRAVNELAQKIDITVKGASAKNFCQPERILAVKGVGESI